ncbi:formyltransferase family protein [Shewanella maritima]|uniref:formyltransferase family protein n=1 Tax=Shewanella maritima TaxID=2520507 RepID=UPI003734E746
MKQLNIILLCAYSARSNAYLQAISQHQKLKHQIKAIVTYGEDNYSIQSERQLSPVVLEALFCPDLTLPISDVIDSFDCAKTHIEQKFLENPSLQQTLASYEPDIIIYSGYGGQIVPESILGLANVLHVHSGYLPNFRGSTTLYHEVIEHSQCAASAIYLEKDIDTGPILNRERYPLPPKGMDVDYLYDNLIRADLLVKTLVQIINNYQQVMPQHSEMPAYYIIHPLLKHLALFKIDAQNEGLNHD